MDQVGKLSITVLCYYACLPETHNNKTTGYSSHTVLTLPCPWPCQLTHPGTAVPRPLAPSSPRPPLPSLPPPPAAQQLLCMPVRELKQAQEGGARLSVTAHLQTLLLLQPLPFVKIPRTMSWALVTRTNLLDSKTSGWGCLFPKGHSTLVFVQRYSSINSLSKHKYQNQF